MVSFACASVLVWIAYDYSQQYSTWFSLTVGALLGVGALGVVIVLFTEAHELAEAVWTPQAAPAIPADHRRAGPIGPRCRSTCPATTSRRNC